MPNLSKLANVYPVAVVQETTEYPVATAQAIISNEENNL